jgi:hypothetical protein
MKRFITFQIESFATGTTTTTLTVVDDMVELIGQRILARLESGEYTASQAEEVWDKHVAGRRS